MAESSGSRPAIDPSDRIDRSAAVNFRPILIILKKCNFRSIFIFLKKMSAKERNTLGLTIATFPFETQKILSLIFPIDYFDTGNKDILHN